MAFFSSSGKIIEGSGGPYILSENFVVAMGSINKFLRGKVYHRCSCGHFLLSATIHGLYFEHFFEQNFINDLKNWKNGDPESDSFKRLVEKCVTFMEETMAGSHGKAA